MSHVPSLLIPENFLNYVLRNVSPIDGNPEDVPILIMVKNWYSIQYPDLSDAQIRQVAEWYISSIVYQGTDLYRSEKFDSFVLTETFRLREENAKLKQELFDKMGI